MPIDYEWGHAVWNGFAGSSGGVGILVYETASGQAVADKRATLWNESMWMSSRTTMQGGDREYLWQRAPPRHPFSWPRESSIWFGFGCF